VPDSRLVLVVGGLFSVGALLIHAGHRREKVSAERLRGDWIKYGVYAAIINALWASAFLGSGAAAALLGGISIGGGVEVGRIMPRRHRVATGTAAAILFAVALGHLMAPRRPGWAAAFAFVVVVTAATDSFAQLCGRLLGRRKLCPRLSPEKTIAGLVGGLAAAVAVAVVLGFLLPGADGRQLALLGLLIGAGAVTGDLLFSAIKRAAGVKDFSRLLPGHGGILDRFDSLLVAAPVFYWSRALLLG